MTDEKPTIHELEKLMDEEGTGIEILPDGSVQSVTFHDELRSLLNKCSMENGSNTPDLILAKYLHNCLDSFDEAVRERDRWYGIVREPGKGACVVKLQALKDCFESYTPNIILTEMIIRFGLEDVRGTLKDLEESQKKLESRS